MRHRQSSSYAKTRRARSAAWFAACAVLAFACGAASRVLVEPPAERLLEQARWLASAGQSSDAQALLRKYLAREPHRTDAKLLLGRLAHDSRDWATEAALYRTVPDSDPLAGAIRVAEGDAWLKLDRARAAENCWRRAYELAGDDPQPRMRLTYLYGVQLRRDPWRRLLWELYDRRQAGVREMIQLMIADHVVWEPEETLSLIRNFIARDDGDLHSRRALAEYLVQAGRTDEAVRQLESITRADSDDPDAWLLLASCQLARGDLAGARAALERLHPPPADYRYAKYLGFVALVERRFDAAIELLETALQSAPYDRETHSKLAQAYRLAEQPGAADEHARTAEALARIHRLCHTLHGQRTGSLAEIRALALLCAELELIEEARGWAVAGLALEPSDPVLREVVERFEGWSGRSPRRPDRGEQP